jgi:class 3 adenylate cyclase/tetratricopeptide (TPR) repeat protein
VTEASSPRSIPEEYAAKMKAARATDSMHGERRLVSILFCDVTGSTAMAKDLDPEDWAEVMHEAFEYLIAPVYRYEGTLARMMGDGIMAFFGAPLAHEDDPERAVLAGLAIIDEIGPFCEKIRKELDLEFNVRVGINTGIVVVGDIGSDLAMEYTAMGDTVNMAARMEETAEPGTVQVSEETYQMIAPLFDTVALEGVEVKGRQEPVQTYRIVAPKSKPGKLRGVEGLSSPLVGRSEEFERLKEALAGLQQGKGGIAFLIGEAGLGKSRLIQEVEREWFGSGKDESTWSVVRGISYDTTQPYSLFQQIIRQSCGIEPEDPPDVILKKLEAFAQEVTPEIADQTGQAIKLMMAIRDEGDGRPQATGDRKREIQSNVLDLLRSTILEPSVLVIDDLHWSDAASAELLEHMLQMTDSNPAMIICAMRPYRGSPAWQLKLAAETRFPHRYTEINLEPLSSEYSADLVGNLLEISDIPPALSGMILEKSEGNPFFVEELIRTLIDSGVVVRDETGEHWRATAEIENISVPDNLQALLTARIDRLDREIRQTVQLASVIGRTFYFRVLEVIADVQDVLNEHLNTLQRVELILERTRIPEIEFMFRHDLTRDAAYNSILKRKRAKFHLRVGEAIEEIFPERLEEEAHLLAYHYREAKEDEKALNYYTLAGNAARRVSAYTEAIDHYSHALEIANRVEASAAQLSFLFTRLGRIYELAGQYDEALENYRQLESLGNIRSEPALEMAALNAMATIHAIPSLYMNSEQAEEYAKRALSLAEDLDDPRGKAKSLWNLMLVENYAERDHQAATDYGERSLAIARENDLEEEIAFALHDLSRAYTQGGQLERAIKINEEARTHWERLGNPEMLADNLTSSSFMASLSGDIQQGIELAEAGLDLSRQNGNFWGQGYSLMGLGLLRTEFGDIKGGFEAFEEGTSLADRADFTGAGVFVHAVMAWLLARFGALERANEIVERTRPNWDERDPTLGFMTGLQAVLAGMRGNMADARPLAQQSRDSINPDSLNPEFLGYATLLRAEMLILEQDFQDALDDVDRSLERLQSIQVRYFVPVLLLRRGMALRGLGRLDEAAETFEEARQNAESMEMRLTQMWVLIEMTELAGEQGQTAGPISEARDSIQYIAERMGDDELSELFLSQPRIRSIMDQ